MKKILTLMMMLIAAFGFYSCSSDDDNPTTPPTGESVTPPAANTPGWSGDFENGTATFTFEKEDYGYDDEEESDVVCDFYTFDFENGICTDAKYCIQFNSSTTANLYANMLNSGAWASFDDEEDDEDDFYDDEDYYYDDEVGYPYMPMPSNIKSIKKVASKMAQTRAGYTDMAMTVYVFNDMVYVPLENYKGKKALVIKNGISTVVNVPEEFIYGEYDSEKGEYICNNAYAITCNGKDIQYKVNMTFTPERYVNSYLTTLTLPNTAWAMIIYESLYDHVEDIGRVFGVTPILTIEGNVVKQTAITRYDIENPELAEYARDVTETEIVQTLKYIDRQVGSPMLRSFAAE